MHMSYERTSTWSNNLILLGAGAALLAAGAECYYLLQDQPRHLLSVVGISHNTRDPMALFRFYAGIAVVAGVLLTRRLSLILPVVAVLGGMHIAGNYGTFVHYTAPVSSQFQVARMQPLAGGQVQTRPQVQQAGFQRQAPTAAPAANTEARQWMRKMTEAGYTRGGPVSAAGRDWCDRINATTGRANRYNDLKAQGNCITGYVWNQ